jgi:hypothetical protein
MARDAPAIAAQDEVCAGVAQLPSRHHTARPNAAVPSVQSLRPTNPRRTPRAGLTAEPPPGTMRRTAASLAATSRVPPSATNQQSHSRTGRVQLRRSQRRVVRI